VPEIDNSDPFSELLAVLDSFEKLDIVVHLYRVRFRPERSSAIIRSLQLSPRSVAEALAALSRAGVVLTSHYDDDAGWWVDPNSCWATSIEVLVDLYETDRNELLRFIRHIALQGTPFEDVPVFTFGPRPRDRKPPAPN
jgi:hypothetical protein